MSPHKSKTGQNMVITKTTAISNSVSMTNVNENAANIGNVNVNLPQISANGGGNVGGTAG